MSHDTQNDRAHKPPVSRPFEVQSEINRGPVVPLVQQRHGDRLPIAEDTSDSDASGARKSALRSSF